MNKMWQLQFFGLAHLLLLSTFFLPVSATAASTGNPEENFAICLFDIVEKQYPSYFSPHVQAVNPITQSTGKVAYIRAYANNYQAMLAVYAGDFYYSFYNKLYQVGSIDTANKQFANGACSTSGITNNTSNNINNATTSNNTTTVNVSFAGDGSGSITSNPTGINCTVGKACNSATFTGNAKIIIQAKPSTDSQFVGWSGVCNGTSTCTIEPNSKSVSLTATFKKKPVIIIRVTAKDSNGHIGVANSLNLLDSRGAMTCINSCTYTIRDPITFSIANGSIGEKDEYAFEGWSGACSGRGVCTIAPSSQNRTVDVTASFYLARKRLDANISPISFVSSTPNWALENYEDRIVFNFVKLPIGTVKRIKTPTNYSLYYIQNVQGWVKSNGSTCGGFYNNNYEINNYYCYDLTKVSN
jgi:hypothetical protein